MDKFFNHWLWVILGILFWGVIWFGPTIYRHFNPPEEIERPSIQTLIDNDIPVEEFYPEYLPDCPFDRLSC